MGANAVTTVPVYTAGEVLTAADLNITNSGIPVFASTVERDAAFGGTGEKTLAEGQFAYLETGNVTQYYDGAAWQAVGVAPALVFITSATAAAVNSLSVNNCFSATYQNYKIIYTQTAATGSGVLTFRLRASGTNATTNYNSNRFYGNGSAAASSTNPQGTDEFYLGDTEGSFSYAAHEVNLFRPFEAASTYITSLGTYNTSATDVTAFICSGQNTNSTSYDGFSLLTTGTNFSGNVRVYGIANS